VVAGAGAALERRLTKKSARMLDNTPFKFAPADGVGYFEKLGWVAADSNQCCWLRTNFTDCHD
jgi:hypothetical protein